MYINKEIVTQLAKHLSDAKYSTKTYYISNEDYSAAAIEFFITYLDHTLRNSCLNSKEAGICDLTWKHDDCRLIMEILFDLTHDDKYMVSNIYY